MINHIRPSSPHRKYQIFSESAHLCVVWIYMLRPEGQVGLLETSPGHWHITGSPSRCELNRDGGTHERVCNGTESFWLVIVSAVWKNLRKICFELRSEGKGSETGWLRAVNATVAHVFTYSKMLLLIWVIRPVTLTAEVRLRPRGIGGTSSGLDVNFLWEDIWCSQNRLLHVDKIFFSSFHQVLLWCSKITGAAHVQLCI